MKKLVLLAVLAGFLGLSVSAADAKGLHSSAKESKIKGKVVVVKDAGGAITAVQIESKKFGTYNVVLDAKGKDLGEKMAGKHVAVKAVETVKDGGKWLTVKSYAKIHKGGKKGHGGKNKK